jgi:hypothetical protein
MFTRVIFAVATTLLLHVPASAEESLFATDQVLEITIRGPLRELARSTEPSTGFAGRFELGDGTKIPMVFSKYGVSRLEECALPLLKIEIDEEHARGNPFEGHRTVRLVTPCHPSSAWDRYTLLEYLAYRCYAVITEPALRARLASVRFLDSERPAFEDTRLSFFLEDIEAAAERHGLEWFDIESQSVDGLDPSELAVLALFQYMVGNTDWSVVASAEGERCCHNVAVFGSDGERFNTLVPFDFDSSGLVNAPYATPNQKLPIHRVTQRWYRGFCASNELVPAAFEIFNEKRPELEWIFRDDRLPDPKARKRAWKYIEAFYETINDPKQAERRILSSCR